MTNLEWMRTLDRDGYLGYLCGMTDGACNYCVYDGTTTCDGKCRENIAAWLDAEHVEPDSLERIREDARKGMCEYWGGSDMTCSFCPHYEVSTESCTREMMLDLIERTVKVMEGKEGR